MKKDSHKFGMVFLLIIMSFPRIGAAQKPMKLPDYLFAEGANPAVMFTLKKLPGKVRNNSITLGGIVLSKTNMSKFEVGGDVASLFTTYLVEDLENIGFSPEVYIDKGALEDADMSFVKMDNHIREQLHKNKVRYILEFVIYGTPEDKIVGKGKATRESFKTASLMIHQYKGGSMEIITAENYSTMTAKADYKLLMTYFGGKVKKAPREQLSVAVEGEPYYDEDFRAYKEDAGFPPDLKDKAVLLPTPRKYKMAGGKYTLVDDEKLKASLTKELDKNYPYKYRFVSYKVLDAKRGTQEYLLEAKVALVIKTKIDQGKGGTTSQQVPRYYYVVRDLSNNDVYYGGDSRELEESADRNLVVAIKYFNKRLKADLGID